MQFSKLLKCSFLISIFLGSNNLKAQHKEYCGSGEVLRNAFTQHALQRVRHERAEQKLLNAAFHRPVLRTTGTTYTIPVVFHVIHNNGAENISASQLLAGLQHLNDAFRNAGAYDTSLGVSTGIQFCLARQDEYGAVSSGITRTASPLTNVLVPAQDLALKNLIRWDPKKYLNIWVVNEITSQSSGAGVAGYAYFPYAHGSVEDGVVCEANYVSASPQNSKVLVHEVGHYLGLYHTFEGGCNNNNCLTDGDRVCDTPPDATSSPYSSCLMDFNSCTTDEDDHSTNNPFRPVAIGGIGDQVDRAINYMDYSDAVCRIIFTPGQKERMIGALTTLRASLLESEGCSDLCAAFIHPAFTPDDTVVDMMSTVQFANTTMGATTYEWFINDVKFSDLANPAYTFLQQGLYTVLMRASNSDVACTKELKIRVHVECATQASFSGPSKIKPADAITFTNTTPGFNTYQWFMDGMLISTGQHLTHTFAAPGGYRLKLVTFNGQCYDTAATFVQVGNCTPGNQGNVWYFGNWTGFEFINDTVQSISFTPASHNVMHMSTEGCVSMSDASGNHLFFANPVYAFNKNRELMPNGSGLLGEWSATQMAVVQNPANPSRYFLFTLDSFGNPNGLRYSEIDMTLDGGLGDVVPATKNTLMLTPVTEKITTVKHANGTDVWVIAHQMHTDSFYVYLVNASGVSSTPVISEAGIRNTGIGLGQLKASPDGCKLASAIFDNNTVEIFSFDTQTGVISSPITITGAEFTGCYGLEFSPDGSKLYVGMESPKTIYQFDLAKKTESGIKNSKTFIASTGGSGYLGAFQIGPYGKIYVARNGAMYIAVINNPNAAGLACNFDVNGISMGRMMTASLPSFDQSYFYNPTPAITGPDTICGGGQNVLYKASASSCASGISQWTLIGRGTITASTDTSAYVDFTEAGIDTLIIERVSSCGTTSDTMFIVVRNSSFDVKDTVRCVAGPVALDAGAGFTSYRWQDNSTSQTFTASSAGKYWVTVITAAGCVITDTVQVTNPEPLNISLGDDLAICMGGLTVLHPGSEYYSYRWQDYSTDSTFTAFLPGTYWVLVRDACGNTDSDTVEITAGFHAAPDLGNAVVLCPGESVTLSAGNTYADYLWQDGSSGNTLTVSSEGIYWIVAIDNAGCYGYDSIEVHKAEGCCTTPEIPNLFTPNKDDHNDVFVINCAGNKGWNLEIYNRWGKLVYRSADYGNDWDGSEAVDGVYYYVLAKEEEVYKGWVHVVR